MKFTFLGLLRGIISFITSCFLSYLFSFCVQLYQELYCCELTYIAVSPCLILGSNISKRGCVSSSSWVGTWFDAGSEIKVAEVEQIVVGKQSRLEVKITL